MIYEILEDLKNESSTNKKVEILSQHKENELLKRVFYYTYNPHYQFGVKKVPKAMSHKGEITLEDVFPLLDDLRNRKITGNKALDAVSYYLQKLDEKDAEILTKILKKDFKIGVNTKLINKVWKNLIPTIPYMGARAYNERDFNKLLGKDLYAEIKYDGEFINLIFKENHIETKSRNGKDLNFEHLFDHKLKNIVLTGEILIRGYDRYSANGILNSLKQLNQKKKDGKNITKELDDFYKKYGKLPEDIEKDIYVVVWDIIPLENWESGYYEASLLRRREDLKKVVELFDNIELVYYKKVKTKEEIFDFYKEALSKGEEGIILKDVTYPWKDGKHPGVLKFKPVISLDLKIVGYEFGNPGTKYENFVNRLILEDKDGKIKTIASGISEKMMEELTKNKDKLVGKICEVECNEISQDREGNYSLLHPRVKTVRDDKNEPNTFQECLDIRNSVLNLKE